MDQSVDQNGVDSENNIFRSFILKQLSSNTFCGERVDSSINVKDYTGSYVRDSSHLLSFQPWISKRDDVTKHGEFVNVNGDSNRFMGFSEICPSPKSLCLGYGSARRKSSLKSRSQRCSVKAVASTEKCLIPQLYTEHFDFKENDFRWNLAPNVPTMRPLIVSDGERVISSSSDTVSTSPKVDEFHRKVAETVKGISPLPESRRAAAHWRKKMQLGTFESSDELSCSQGSFFALLYCVGVAVGSMSNAASSQKEIDKLNSMLKHSESLVQDLQEELDMKESLTVKEIVNDSCEKKTSTGSDSNVEECVFFFDKVEECVNPACFAKQANEQHNSDAMIKIEEELQAELERLEFNINASSLEGKISELHVELLTNCNGNLENNSTTQTCNPNDPVSPRELSLRLHEAIQTQLEEQIKDLEIALDRNEKHIRFVERQELLRVYSPAVDSKIRSVGGEKPLAPMRAHSSSSTFTQSNPSITLLAQVRILVDACARRSACPLALTKVLAHLRLSASNPHEPASPQSFTGHDDKASNEAEKELDSPLARRDAT
ncbi:hypothetical protein AXF42_Ash000575 [Apostasia shenzhenica]|uniref:Uncharacterized protein n=1 Tax=Apostasia shenzhenica TaxID=1088818 RepID=A0A2I0AGS2_9ASPA|nr:hypothetical protein AXF42_Ash000575 [Apostasia shenzhenica]